jgi:hypothetical protein
LACFWQVPRRDYESAVVKHLAEHFHLPRQSGERVQITLQLVAEQMIAYHGDVNASALANHELIDD